MNDSEANELRLVANEILRRLYEGGHVDQIRILELYAKQAIEEIKKETGKTPSY